MKEADASSTSKYPAAGGKKRYYPSRFQMKNLLQKDTITELQLDNPRFDDPIPDDVFSLANLGRGN
ncbi:MAG: outer membrane lipoprotein-sorting protein [Acidobacteriota bacterium]